MYAITLIVTCACLLGVFGLFQLPRRKSPPRLLDPIPGIFNTAQFILSNARFMKRALHLLETTNIARFNLMLTPVFLLSGSKNIQTLFRSTDVHNEKQFLKVAFPGLYNMQPADIQRFANDKSGHDRQPIPGTQKTSAEHRYWYGYHHVHAEYLVRPQYFRPLAVQYRDLSSRSMNEKFPSGVWRSTSLRDFCRREVAEASIGMLFGPMIYSTSSELLDAFWAFDKHMMAISLLPKFLAKDAYDAQSRFHDVLRTYMSQLSNSSTNTDEALLPARLLEWARSGGFREESMVGMLGALIFALLSNSIPTTIWTLIEILSDQSLLRAVREEVETAYTSNPSGGTKEFDVEKLVTLPLLQSIFTEVLRLHMSFNLLRDVREPFVINGYPVEKGDMLTAPMEAAHYNEQTWGAPDHPANEFWAERHIRYRTVGDPEGAQGSRLERSFVLEGKSGSYYPFGGGSAICPGRFLAKCQVLTTVALIVSKMDIEVENWEDANGQPSSRRAQNDAKYSGLGAVAPDRDLRCRWRRRAGE